MTTPTNEIKWCNWTFWECLVPSKKWVVGRDCQEGYRQDGTTIHLTRGDSRNWKAYSKSLEPRYQGQPPLDSSKCPNCLKYVNAVNPYDDGETWRM